MAREWLPGPPMPLLRVLIYTGAAVVLTLPACAP